MWWRGWLRSGGAVLLESAAYGLASTVHEFGDASGAATIAACTRAALRVKARTIAGRSGSNIYFVALTHCAARHTHCAGSGPVYWSLCRYVSLHYVATPLCRYTAMSRYAAMSLCRYVAASLRRYVATPLCHYAARCARARGFFPVCVARAGAHPAMGALALAPTVTVAPQARVGACTADNSVHSEARAEEGCV